jgi:hemoglobin
LENAVKQVAISFITVVVASCAAPAPTDTPTLYTRLGGEAMVARIADELIDRTAHDERTKRSFQDVKLARVKEKLREQLCVLAGGPCVYTGDPMKEVHKGLKNTEAEMSLMVQFLREILDNAGVRTAEKNELLRLLAPMKRDIVTG